MSLSKAQDTISQNLREKRLQMNLTQQGLAVRSGVPLATLRKFEQKGVISLESLLKLLMVLGMLDSFVRSLEIPEESFASIDEVIARNRAAIRKRGRKN